jgi:hypothetical protein
MDVLSRVPKSERATPRQVNISDLEATEGLVYEALVVSVREGLARADLKKRRQNCRI